MKEYTVEEWNEEFHPNKDNKILMSDVRNSIQKRIQKHKDYINSSLELIKNENRPIDVILTLTDEISRTQIRISELEAVLEYCL